MLNSRGLRKMLDYGGIELESSRLSKLSTVCYTDSKRKAREIAYWVLVQNEPKLIALRCSLNL